MTTDDFPWEPPLAGTEVEHLTGALDRLRTTFRWKVTSAAHDSPAQLYAAWDDAVGRSHSRLDAALSEGGLDQLVDVSGPDGVRASLRRLLFDLVEEYGRHTGQADLLREAVDGLVGEDPPAGWHT